MNSSFESRWLSSRAAASSLAPPRHGHRVWQRTAPQVCSAKYSSQLTGLKNNAMQRQTLRSVMDSAMSTLLVSSSWIVFSSNSSYSVSRAAIRPSSSSRLRMTISFSSWLCRRRSTVSRTNDCPSASCRRTDVKSSTVNVFIPLGESMASSFARIWRRASSFSEKAPC